MRTTYLLILLTFLLSAQISAQDYERIDATIELYPTSFNSVEELANFITRDFQTEEEKVRAMTLREGQGDFATRCRLCHADSPTSRHGP